MKTSSLSFTKLFTLFLLCALGMLVAGALQAWTGPTGSPPSNNVSAPINVGTANQVKNGGLSVNALAVFGSTYVQNDLGVNNNNPVVALQVNGTVMVGNGGEVCQSVTAGAIRFNTSNDKLNYCNGTSWQTLAVVGPQQIVLTSGSSWTVPSDWNSSNNSIEVIGGGGGGGANASNGYEYGGGGGGGGGYAKAVDVTLTPNSVVSYSIGAGGVGGSPGQDTGVSGGDTWFCNSSSNCSSRSDVAVVAAASGGQTGVDYTGGAGGIGVTGSVKYSGGAGGSSTAQLGGGGGGGAAGSHGAGLAGMPGNGGMVAGGNGDAGYGGAGSPGAAGGNGSEWGSYGSGAGGSGVVAVSNAYNGGNAGGGGGGVDWYWGGSFSSGSGATGIIVINYAP